MTLRVGRVGVQVVQSNVALVDQQGDDVHISGRVSWSGGFEASVVREQILGLSSGAKEKVVPVVFDEHPYINGYYTVDTTSVEMGPGSVVIGYFPFSMTLTRMRNFSSPLIESRLLGTIRGNSASVTTCAPWVGVPANSESWAGPSTVGAPDVRDTESGPVEVFSEANGATPAMLNAFVSFTVDPQFYYVGASRVDIGSMDDLASTTFSYTGASQSYVVPTGITTIRIDARGAQGGGSKGGRGDRAVCEVTVTPGETLTVRVGQHQGVPVTAAFPNGGAGRGSGYAGGGRTEVVRSSTRLAVAGGGGGMGFGGGGDHKRPGGNSGEWGEAGPDSDSGDGGQATAGGAGGSGSPAGSAGASLQGGAASTGTFSNSGGGGDGLYGGGGGGGAGGGGGGSSLITGTNALHYAGYQVGHGSLVISEIPATPLEPQRYTVVGDQCMNSQFGWLLTNGIIKVTPVYSSTKVALLIQPWDGAGWGAGWVWNLTDNGSSTTPATAFLTNFIVIDNDPECTIIRCTAEYVGKRDSISITLTLRRGAPMVEVYLASKTTAMWGFRLNAAAAGTAVTGQGIVQTTAASGGSKYLGVCPVGVTVVLTSNAGWHRTVATTTFSIGLGALQNGASATALTLAQQYYAAMTESLRAVAR